MADAKQTIGARAGRELKDGQIINLGIGLPTLIANFVPEGVDVVIQTENVANWIVPGKMLAGMGGAMDLMTGAKTVYIVSDHCSKDGASKLMKQCTFPLTGAEEADVIITERALFRRYPDKGFVLEEVAVGYTLDDIAGCTDMAYTVADDVALDAFGE